jgi:hypothetical protein
MSPGYCSRRRFAGLVRSARRTGPATEREAASSMTNATETSTNGSCGSLVDDGGEQPACRCAQHYAHYGPAREQHQHTAERRPGNLLRLRPERDTNTQLAQPLANRIGGQTKGARDRKQQPKSANDGEGGRRHLGSKEVLPDGPR